MLILFLIPFLILTGLYSINILGLPLYLDEGLYVFWASLFTKDPSFAYLSLQDGKTPFYIWLISFLSRFFTDPLLTGRLISVLGAAVTAFCWVLIVFKITGVKKTAVLYAALFLITPYSVLIGRMAFVDSLLTAFASLSLLMLFMAFACIKANELKIIPAVICVTLSGLFLALAYMTKTSAKIFLFAELFMLLFWGYQLFKDKKIAHIILLIFFTALSLIVYKELTGYMQIGAHRFWGMIESKESQLTFSVPEILKRVFVDKNISIYLTNAPIAASYLLIYLSSFLVFTAIGIIQVIKKQRQLFWLLGYLVFLSAGVFLSGKVVASRYYYILVPPLLAFSAIGLLYLWQGRFKKILASVLIAIPFLQSGLMILNPAAAFYAPDDKSYFLSGDLSATGLYQSIKLLQLNSEKSAVGISGVWGVAEGSQAVFESQGIQTVKLNRLLDNSAPASDSACPTDRQLINDRCWKLSYQNLTKIKTDQKYLYLTDFNDQKYSIFNQLQPAATTTKIFSKPNSKLKVYLIKMD